jgi:hypothetical protein
MEQLKEWSKAFTKKEKAYDLSKDRFVNLFIKAERGRIGTGPTRIEQDRRSSVGDVVVGVIVRCSLDQTGEVCEAGCQ